MGINTSEMQQVLISSCCILLMAFSKVLGETQNTCKELKCGDKGPPIHFPFRLKDRQPDHCGYRGFAVSCNERHQTVLELPILVKLCVKSIDYEHQQISFYDPDNCLLVKDSEILNMSIFPFHFSKESMNITLFNCSAVLERRPYNDRVLNGVLNLGNQIYAIYDDYEIDNLQPCTKMHNVLSGPVSNLDRSLSVLRWSTPNCTKCEAGGKKCMLKNNDTRVEIECVDLKKAVRQ
ncbi:unnamed protein product [Prunus armeniaca]